MAQEITLEMVKQAAREQYAAGKLTAQHPDQSRRKCVYATSDGYHCAIGAALNAQVLSRIAESDYQSISAQWLIDDGYIIVDREREVLPITKIQDAHDTWCGVERGYDPIKPGTSTNPKKYEAKFLKLIAA